MVDLMLVDPRSMVQEENRMTVLQTLFELLGRVETLLDKASDLNIISTGHTRERTIALWSSLLGISSMQKMRRLYPEQVPANNLTREILHSLFIAWGCDASAVQEASNQALEFLQDLSTDTPQNIEGDPLWRSLS